MGSLKILFNKILHNGLTTYKAKHSKATLPAQVQAKKIDKMNKKGAIFAVKSKEHFMDYAVKGYIVTSEETIIEDANKLTHWTPNVYRIYGYTDDKKRNFIRGYEEKNLLQINTFVIDIDTEKHDLQEILISCIDNSIGAPTIVLKTDRGYQLYFVLETPIYISNKNDFRSLKVAKRISNNLKLSLQGIDADLYCNDFGFYRIPKADNVVWEQLDNTYTVSDLIQWSMRQDDNIGRDLYVINPNRSFDGHLISRSEWFTELLNTKEIKGAKGQIGRNNALFTVALICFQDGLEQADTYNLLDQFNSNLRSPLKSINSVIESAYSGKYIGPKKEYIETLLNSYVSPGKYKINLGSNRWYKHKKDRSERVRVHLHEWEQDILSYLNGAEKSSKTPFVWHTQKELCQTLGIPESTLNKVLKTSKLIIKTIHGVGRGSKTGLTTMARFIQHAISSSLHKKNSYQTYLEALLSVIEDSEIKVILTTLLQQLNLLKTDATREIQAIGSG